MLLLIAFTNLPGRRLAPESPGGSGVQFWSLMYIPIIVAMAAKQNVLAAISGGFVAIAAGTLAVVVAFALVPWLSRLGRR